MGIMRTARVVAAGAVGAVALGGCGLQLLGGSDGADGTDGDAPPATRRVRSLSRTFHRVRSAGSGEGVARSVG